MTHFGAPETSSRTKRGTHARFVHLLRLFSRPRRPMPCVQGGRDAMHSSWFWAGFRGSRAVTTVETVVPTFTTLDRCDRCGARAYLRVWLEKSELLFCAHHAREHHAALAVAVHPDLIEARE